MFVNLICFSLASSWHCSFFLYRFEVRMTSSDCLSTNNLHPRLSAKSRLNLPVSTVHNVTDEMKKSVSCTSTPTSSSPLHFYAPTVQNPVRFNHPNMLNFPRPPQAPATSRRNIGFRVPEQEVLDKNFFQAFNMEQKNEKTSQNQKSKSLLFFKLFHFSHNRIK